MAIRATMLRLLACSSGESGINTFSAVLAQIQLIWQVLGFRDKLVAGGFPDLNIASSNALVQTGLDTPPNAFTVLDRNRYDAVVGNPPYIRAERNQSLLDPFSRDYFEAGSGGGGGISAESDTYALFLYKALDAWCRPLDETGTAGRVGFVVPLALLDANENERMRELFRVGGRWTIVEIVDLELVYESVFDADTIPMIFVAEARPATEDDVVHIRLADETAVRVVEGAIRPDFDFASMPAHDVRYPDLFTADGRIPTRINAERRRILDQMRFDSNFGDVAKPYWVKRGRGGITAWRAEPPTGAEIPLWSERRMLTGGCAFRGQRAVIRNGLDIYKGENIVVGEIFGEPALRSVDVAGADDPSIWRYAGEPTDAANKPNILPRRAYAIAAVAHAANLCAFDPATTAFTNTAQIFVPRDEFVDFPFDLLCLSNVYVYWFALLGRMGLLRTQRSHIYPTNFQLLPWSADIAAIGPQLEVLRTDVVDACRAYYATSRQRSDALTALGLTTVKARCRANPSIEFSFSASFDVPDFSVEMSPGDARYQGGEWVLPLSRSLFDYVSSNDERLVRGIGRAVVNIAGEAGGRKEILNLQVPYDEEETRAWDGVVAQFDETLVAKRMASALGRLDEVVGTAVGLDSTDLREIEADMQADPFLSHVRPRYPGITVRIQGFRGSLDSSERYA